MNAPNASDILAIKHAVVEAIHFSGHNALQVFVQGDGYGNVIVKANYHYAGAQTLRLKWFVCNWRNYGDASIRVKQIGVEAADWFIQQVNAITGKVNEDDPWGDVFGSTGDDEPSTYGNLPGVTQNPLIPANGYSVKWSPDNSSTLDDDDVFDKLTKAIHDGMDDGPSFDAGNPLAPCWQEFINSLDMSGLGYAK